MLRCSRRSWSSSARPLRAAEPFRSMFNDDGGVDRTVSSSRIRRARSSRGTFPGIVDGGAFRDADRLGLPGFRFGAARLATAFRALLLLRAVVRFAVRAFAAVFLLVGRRDLTVRLAFGLAIVSCPFEP